jgi:hypothetical protein
MAKDRVHRIRLLPERDQWPATVKMARSVRVPQTAGNVLIKLMVINDFRTTVRSLESRLLLNVSRRCSYLTCTTQLPLSRTVLTVHNYTTQADVMHRFLN